jgi:SAM-dependent methyltransferase
MAGIDASRFQTKISKNSISYSDARYWNSRYSEKGTDPKVDLSFAPFEWYLGFEQLKETLIPLLPDKAAPAAVDASANDAIGVSSQDDGPRVLVLGCGTSTLSEQLFNEGYVHITNIDRCEALVEHLATKHQDKRDTMRYYAVDVKNLPLASCAHRRPVIADAVRMLDNGKATLADRDGNADAWYLEPGEKAYVVEISDEGTFRLSNPDGLESIFTDRRDWVYIEALCTLRQPVLADIVRSLEFKKITMKDKDGNDGAWNLEPGENATVVEVNSDGDFRLCNPDGLESVYADRRIWAYVEAPCTNRQPVIATFVRALGNKRITMRDKDGNEGAWNLQPGGKATVVEINEDGNFRLRHPDGLISIFADRKEWIYAEEYRPVMTEKKQEWSGYFDAVIDKACLDMIACGKEARLEVPLTLSAISRLLKPLTGVYISISHAAPELRQPMLSGTNDLKVVVSKKMRWRVSCFPLPRLLQPPADSNAKGGGAAKGAAAIELKPSISFRAEEFVYNMYVCQRPPKLVDDASGWFDFWASPATVFTRDVLARSLIKSLYIAEAERPALRATVSQVWAECVGNDETVPRDAFTVDKGMASLLISNLGLTISPQMPQP